MGKYTPETALAIKRDVEKSQVILGNILREIEERNAELRSLNAILDEKRGFMARFEDMVAGVFSRGHIKVQEHEKHIESLTNAIYQLETARDLLNAEIILKKEQVPESDGSILVKSLIAQLEPVLDKLLTDISQKEQYLSSLNKNVSKFEKATKLLATEAQKQEKLVEKARLAAKEATEKREKALKELARETQQLSIIRQRERDSSAMNKRLSSEYQAIYNAVPRRGNKKAI